MSELDQEMARATDQERAELLAQYEEWVEVPALLLGLAWLALLVIDLLGQINPLLSRVFDLIWVLFLVDFIIRLVLSPRKLLYLKTNWLTALSLAVPALRIARFARLFQAARAARGLRLFRLVSSLNRGMRALRHSFSRRGFGYVILLTVIITLVGAAGMFAFEGPSTGQTGGLESYSDALWWTAMTMTTMGSGDFSPQTAEGRLLGLLLAVYAFAVFGYVTAALASFFIGRDTQAPDAELSCLSELSTLRSEIQALRAELAKNPGSQPDPGRE